MPGYAPDWCRKNMSKIAKMADGGPVRVTGGGEGKDDENFGMGGRASLSKKLSEDSDLEVGVAGHAARWRTQGSKGSDIGVDAVDLTYRKGDTSVSVGRVLNNTNPDIGSTMPGNKGWTFNITKEFADGGIVKKTKR